MFNLGVGIIELLYKSNLVALVGGGEQPVFPPTKVIIWDDYQNKGIAELEYDNPVRAVRLKRDIIVVVIDTSVFIYDFRNLNMRSTFKTCPNPKGLIAVSSSGRTKTIVEAARLAKDGGARVIVLTDYKNSPLTRSADLLLSTTNRQSPDDPSAELPLIQGQLTIVDMVYALLSARVCIEGVAKTRVLVLADKHL